MTIYVVEMNEWGCGLYSGAGNVLTFVSFCDKNTATRVVCSVGDSPENTVVGRGSAERKRVGGGGKVGVMGVEEGSLGKIEGVVVDG